VKEQADIRSRLGTRNEKTPQVGHAPQIRVEAAGMVAAVELLQDGSLQTVEYDRRRRGEAAELQQ
jgi:hypothetical protein